MTSQFLKMGNPRKVVACLDGVLDNTNLEKIELELERHSIKLYSLALYHYRFATSQSSTNWRQKVSRLYYSSYSASRAIRLFVSGQHSEEVIDHKKIGDLPNDFPRLDYFSNRLTVLREDRNTSDYDHMSLSRDLAISHNEAQLLVADFLLETRQYLMGRGLRVRGRP